MIKTNRFLAGFKPVLKALLLFLVLNLSVFVALSLCPSLLGCLWLSADRPWGIVTSAFSHADLDHMLSNTAGFFSAATFFVLINMNKQRKTRHRLSTWFLLLAFGGGIATNLLHYPFFLSNPVRSSYGASGIVYGAFGIVFSCALLDLPSNVRFIAREHKRWARSKKNRRVFAFDFVTMKFFSSLFAVSLVISFLLLIIFDINSFLNVAPEVDVFAHGVGFLIGFIAFTGFRTFWSGIR